MKISWMAVVVLVGTLQGQTATGSFVKGTAADEAAIRAIMANDAADVSDPHEAADLDWENAFGIRFFDVKKRDKWFNAGVKPQFKDATDTTLEVNVRFVTPDVAEADEYWHVVGQVYAGETKPGPDRWGRTTYIFKKEKGVWMEVVSRVADLRAQYFKHYSELPKAVAVPAGTLASYAGTYVAANGKTVGKIEVEGDHLKTKYAKDEAYVVIPISATEFLEFDPEMLATYQKLTFSTLADGTVSCAYARADGRSLGTATKAK